MHFVDQLNAVDRTGGAICTKLVTQADEITAIGH
mgnify:CR=1 FL=1